MAKLDMTYEADSDHTYGLAFRYFAGNDKVHIRWFTTIEDGKTFAGRNAIVIIDFLRADEL